MGANHHGPRAKPSASLNHSYITCRMTLRLPCFLCAPRVPLCTPLLWYCYPLLHLMVVCPPSVLPVPTHPHYLHCSGSLMNGGASTLQGSL